MRVRVGRRGRDLDQVADWCLLDPGPWIMDPATAAAA